MVILFWSFCFYYQGKKLGGLFPMKKIIYRKSLLFIFLILFFFWGCDSTVPTTDQTPLTSGAVHNLTQGIYYDTIQEAIDEAKGGNIIEISYGTYYENLLFANKNITVRSTDPSDNDIVTATIIDGDNEVVIRFTEGDTSTLEGFTVQNGEATLSGGGIYIRDSSPTITRNIITNNIGTINGGGIYINNGSPTITMNTITGNQAKEESGGGIFMWNNSSPIISDNIINKNTAIINGGGICIQSSIPAITGNTIINSKARYGGGIYLADSNVSISDNIITGNSAFGGGAIYAEDESSPLINNNIITDNESENSGGGIYL